VPADDVVHELPMRWADLDSLNHVNNVVYLDYAAESRAMLADDGLVGADEPVARIGIDFLRPLLLSRRPVQVVSRRDGSDLTQEIRSAGHDTVFARVVTSFGEAEAITPADGAEHLPAQVRRSDLDPTGSVSTTKMFELFQEGRVLFLGTRLSSMSPGRFVVGRVEVTYGLPMPWRSEPYEMRTWISRVGSSSVTIGSQIALGDVVHAECVTVLVGFDLEAQRSRRLTDAEKDELGALLVG
jgi:acyl-CoA thioester hydrolase